VWPTKAPVTVGRREETNKFQAVLEKILERGI
jgi:hypothetical protein